MKQLLCWEHFQRECQREKQRLLKKEIADRCRLARNSRAMAIIVKQGVMMSKNMGVDQAAAYLVAQNVPFEVSMRVLTGGHRKTDTDPNAPVR